VVDARALGSENGRDLVDVVPDSRDELHLYAQLGQTSREPGRVRVFGIA
jgi:hypothetical protein